MRGLRSWQRAGEGAEDDAKGGGPFDVSFRWLEERDGERVAKMAKRRCKSDGSGESVMRE